MAILEGSLVGVLKDEAFDEMGTPLEHSLAGDTFVSDLARLKLGQLPLQETGILRDMEKLDSRIDGADFVLSKISHLFYAFGDR